MEGGGQETRIVGEDGVREGVGERDEYGGGKGVGKGDEDGDGHGSGGRR